MQKKKQDEFSLANLIKQRRTIHNFRTGEIPSKKLIKSAIELARWAPNHRMTEPWHFYLIGEETAESICLLNHDIVLAKKGKEGAEKKLQRWRKIPGWLLVTCDRSDDDVTQQEDYAACCCAIQNLLLFLWHEGVGVKWTSGDVIRDPRFYELVWVDKEQESSVGLLWYGYAEEIPNMSRAVVEESYVELP